MQTPVRIAAFATGLVVVFASAVGVGRAVGPVGSAGPTGPTGSAGQPVMDHNAMTEMIPPAGRQVGNTPIGGVASAQDGYLLQLAQPIVRAGQATRFGFAVLGPDGEYLRDYQRSHDKELHLVLVRRDLTGFQHLHPTRDEQGRWFVPLVLEQPGAYKVFADFVPAGTDSKIVLAADVTVPGEYDPVRPAAPTRTVVPTRTEMVDDYTVTLAGDLIAGTQSALSLSVSRAGRPVTDLEPYLAAYGHLVALRVGDLAYLHVHPEGGPGDGRTPAGPAIEVVAAVPTAGTYALFLDFQHRGTVRTAAFTVTAKNT